MRSTFPLFFCFNLQLIKPRLSKSLNDISNKITYRAIHMFLQVTFEELSDLTLAHVLG
jgi:hypothetical protein